MIRSIPLPYARRRLPGNGKSRSRCPVASAVGGRRGVRRRAEATRTYGVGPHETGVAAGAGVHQKEREGSEEDPDALRPPRPTPPSHK
eukprot:3681031-Pyramimonas_sp.AAC.2